MGDDRPPPTSEGLLRGGRTTELIERSLVMLLVLGLLVGVLAILRPFTTAILFGTALAITAWPLRQALLRYGLRPGLAASLLLLLALVVVALPVLLLGPTLVEQITAGAALLKEYLATNPPRPSWLARIPLAGERFGNAWDAIIRSGGEFQALIAPYAAALRGVLVGAAEAAAQSVLQILLSLIVAVALWVQGEALATILSEIFGRLAGPTAVRALEVAAGAVRGVAYGVIGTAALQGALMGLGLAIAGVPGSGMLGFLTFLLAVSQIGAPLLILVWGGAAFWMFEQGSQIWGVFLIALGLFVGMVDNFVKPWLIGFGVEMPMTLILLGVFGGFLAFGFLGLFIGPTLMAIAFTLLQAWRAADPRAGVDAGAGGA
jgi:predicted PurR-regulated permease PerM